MEYKVVIPCAGLGSRLKNLSQHVNKALVTVSNRPVISFIVEKFPESAEIIVPLGYKKEGVREFLTLTYPKRNFVFVDIDNYEGEGSGLGYTLIKCREHLQCPFIFVSNDTIVTDDIPEPSRNWMGYAEGYDVEQYRSLKLDAGGMVTEICSKGASGDVKPYIGLAGIRDWAPFWKAMEEGTAVGSIEVGESFGLKFLVQQGIKALPFEWYDAGNLASLEKARATLVNGRGPNILEKEGETIWFVDGKVIKFSIDKDFIKNRVQRVRHLLPYVPEIVNSSGNMYAYRMVGGEIFSQNPKLNEFRYFLEWMDGFWKRRELGGTEREAFRDVCLDFYRDKTYKRVRQYFKRFEQIDIEETINGRHVPRLFDILEKVDWSYVADGIPSRFHGDLHFENVLVNDNGAQPFTLLDWRQDFGGLLEYGDLYYDLAKLNHGLIISHELIARDLFTVNHKLDKVEFDFYRKHCLVECENYLRQYIGQKGYDFKKVELLTALIFLNIAPLHHYPYTLLLFYLGKSMLYDTLSPGGSRS